jgi:hypothetical protein
MPLKKVDKIKHTPPMRPPQHPIRPIHSLQPKLTLVVSKLIIIHNAPTTFTPSSHTARSISARKPW